MSQGGKFPDTRWTLISSLREGDASQREEAIAELCRSYWYPVYCFARRSGLSTHDSEDLTQAFFQMTLKRDLFANVTDGKRGRLRSLILKSVSNLIASNWRKEQAAKRGGREPKLSLDLAEAEPRYQIEDTNAASPESAFERQWAASVMTRGFERLAEEYQEAGKSEKFQVLSPCLSRPGDEEEHIEMASRLGIQPPSVRTEVHRLRKQFRAMLRDEVSRHCNTLDDPDEELRYLHELLASSQ